MLGNGRVTGVELLDGGTIEAEMCLVATGISPNAELAEAAGLEVRAGVSVDDRMRTSDPHVFAVGDVVDHGGRRYGLWPASVEQAQVAATNIVGGEAAYRLAAPPARLKVPGVDLLSVGAIDAVGGGSHTVVVTAHGTRGYRKLVLEDGRLAGAILLGNPELFDDVTAAVEQRVEVGTELDALERGKWEALSRAVADDTLPTRESSTEGGLAWRSM